ncbi:gliding motility-associated C-terminal domain-containing protein [Litoribacter alkaliphilus]|uniref:Gliding motility-associated C-terminal domain-containing protein n=1 Tax=Litoribacter ruber TaxID=702568 RepID=A0AAP2CGT2_9BACT|nr:MBG domain-containing protein [Litoribacter alkaliphilus]MBS9523304.1 gliding motility-associated C-terminal domain-containing protein [Litoribacter alkaliphilus]
MTRNFKTTQLKQSLLLWAGFMLSCLAVSAQSIETEKPDYLPGDTVVMTGSGWQPGELVELSIVEVPTELPNMIIRLIADSDGNLFSKEFITQEHHLGKALFIEAKGNMGGKTDFHFTDASFSSAKSGPWNKGETWGHPGNDVEGSGYPGAKDVATILNGHAVTLYEDASALRVTISGNVEGTTKIDLNGHHLRAVEWITLASSNSALRRCELHINGGTLTTAQVNVNTLNNGFSKVYLLEGRVNTNIFRIDSHYSNAFIRGWSELEIGDEGVLDVTGNFIRTGTGDSKIFASENSHVLFTGSQGQLLRLEFGYVYGNVKIISNGTVYVRDHITPEKVKGNITIEKGTFFVENNTSISGQPGKVFHLKDGTRLRLNGHWANSFPTVIIDKNSTVQYATGTQNIGAISYGNLEVTGSGNKYLTGTTTVQGRFSIGLNYSFRPGNHNLILQGDFYNNGIYYPESSTVTFSSKSSKQTLSGRATTFNNIVIDKEDGEVELGSNNISINGLLDLKQGKIITGMHEVRVNGAANIAGGSALSYVIGNLRRLISPTRQQYDFPIGTALGFTPSLVKFYELTGSGSVLGKSIDGPHPYAADLGFDPILNRHWEFENEVDGFNNFDLSLAFLPADMSENSNYNNFMVGKHNGSLWSYPAVGNKTQSSIQVTGLTSFSSFAVGSGLVVTKTTVVNPAPIKYGSQSVFLSAKVERQSNSAPIEEGSVDFFVDEIKVGTSNAIIGGEAILEFNPSLLKVGNYQIKAVYSGEGMIAESSTDVEGGGVLVVEKADLLIRIKDQVKIYGETFSFSESDYLLEGLVNADKVNSVSLLSIGMDAASSVTLEGEAYPIMANAAQGEGLENYDIQYLDGRFSVTAKPIVLHATDRIKTYGEELDLGTGAFTVEEGALVNEDIIKGVKLESMGALDTASVGRSYPIIASEAEGVGLENYDIEYKEGILEVKIVPLIVSNLYKVKKYGEVLDEIDFAGSITGVVAGDQITVNRSSTGEIESASVGVYPIVGTLADPNSRLGNYIVTNENGLLTVDPASLTVVNNARSKVYGTILLEADYTGSISGIQAGDDITVTRSSVGEVEGADVGSYPIVGDLKDPNDRLSNYLVTYENGMLTVDRAALTVVNTDRTKEYGVSLLDPDFMGSISGIQAGDNITVTRSSVGEGQNADVGTYSIVGALVDPDSRLVNYEVSNADGTLTVTPATTSISVSNAISDCGKNIKLIATVSSTALFEVNNTGGRVEFINGENLIGFVEPTVVTNGKFEGAFLHNFNAGGEYNIQAEFIPNSGNLIGSITTNPATVTVLNSTVTSSVAENRNGNVVIFDGAAISLGLPSITTLTASIAPVNAGVTYKWSYFEKGVSKQLLSTSNSLQVNGSGDFVREYMVEMSSNGVCVASAMFKVISVEASCGNDNNKVQVCQIPSGNPNNRKTICVNANAVSALLANSESYIGSCDVSYRVDEGENVQPEGEHQTAEMINVRWNTPFEDLQVKLIEIGKTINKGSAPVKWFSNDYDPLRPGVYQITGEYADHNGKGTNMIIVPTIVSDKAIPTDITVSNLQIANNISTGEIIANIMTVDEMDDMHEYKIEDAIMENSFFAIRNGKLIWNSSELAKQRPLYQIRLSSTDRVGNTISRNFTLHVENSGFADIEIFNTFTPDNDGVNDTWGVPELKTVVKGRITVYDRFGRQVFRSVDPIDRWDGKANGVDQPVGAYFFVIESGQGEVRRGTLNLLRK